LIEILHEIFPNLLNLSLNLLARIWQLFWASVVLKTCTNQAHLALIIIFVFYLIKFEFKPFNSKINR
jgi:hypothetical protein